MTKLSLISRNPNCANALSKLSAFDVKFLLSTEAGSSLILSSWIIRQNETFPRLTNAYPVNK